MKGESPNNYNEVFLELNPAVFALLAGALHDGKHGEDDTVHSGQRGCVVVPVEVLK